MRLDRFVLVCHLVIFSAGICPAAAGWGTDWESACSTARSRSKPLVVVFEHEGCGECARMSQTLAAASSRNALSSAVKLRLETDHAPDLVSRFEISLTPTLLVLSPDGDSLKEVYREVGALSTSRIAQIGKSVDKLADRLAPKPEPKEQAVASAAAPPAPVSPAAAEAPATAQVENPAPKKPASTSTRRKAKRSTSRTTKKQQQPQRSRYSNPSSRPVQYQQEQRRRFWPFW